MGLLPALSIAWCCDPDCFFVKSSASCSSFLAFFISSNFSPVPKSLLHLPPFFFTTLLLLLLTLPPTCRPPSSFLSFFYPFGAALARALRYFQTLAGCGMSQGCRRLYTLAPLLPFFFARRTDVCQGDVSVRVARRIMGAACARSGATLMRSYLPAFAKAAWVHRYCAALNGGTRCTVSPSRRHTGSGGAALLFWTLARRPSSGLGHTALSIPHLVRSGQSSSVGRG